MYIDQSNMTQNEVGNIHVYSQLYVPWKKKKKLPQDLARFFSCNDVTTQKKKKLRQNTDLDPDWSLLIYWGTFAGIWIKPHVMQQKHLQYSVECHYNISCFFIYVMCVFRGIAALIPSSQMETIHQQPR